VRQDRRKVTRLTERVGRRRRSKEGSAAVFFDSDSTPVGSEELWRVLQMEEEVGDEGIHMETALSGEVEWEAALVFVFDGVDALSMAGFG
jgi:hypothetical protein